MARSTVLKGARELVGRDRERALFSAALADVRGGRRVVLLVEGAAGMGKTTLVRTALDDSPAVVVWASGDEAEVHVDHGVIDQLVRAAPLGEPDRRELRAEIGDDPLRTGAALVRLVDGFELDQERPLVVVIDDAQWADRASLRALTFAARRLRRDPVLLCCIVRTEDVDALPGNLLRLVDDEGTRIVLGALDRGAVRELAEQAVGHEVSRRATDRLLEHTLGSPLHLTTLLAELPPDAVTGGRELPSPRSFSTLVLSRLAGCRPEVEALVTAVAVLGEPALLSTAARVVDLADPVGVLAEAEAHGLLVVVPDAGAEPIRVATPHPLVRAAVMGDLPVGRRAELHRRAGALVPGSAGLRHRLLGTLDGDSGLWCEAMLAARTDACRGAHAAAGALHQLASRVATTDAERELALEAAAGQLLLAGQLEDVAALRAGVEAGAPSAERSFVRGHMAYVLGPRREARRHLDAAWEALVHRAGGATEIGTLPSAARELAGRVAAMLATVSVDRGDGAEAIRWCRAALELAPEQAALASAAHMLAGAYALTGQFDDGRRDLDARCAAALGSGRSEGPVRADVHSARGLLRLWTHDLEGAAADFEASLAAATRGSSFAARETARFYLAEVRYRQGRWDDAVLLAELSASLVDDSDQAWMATLPHATAARPLAARGEGAQHHIDRASEAAVAVGVGVGRVLAGVAAVEVAACSRDHELVVTVGDELHADALRHIDERIAPWRASYAEALVALGRVDDAAVQAAILAEGCATPLMATDAARALVAVAVARRDDAAVDQAAAEGLALDPEAVGPYPRARLELAVGRAWRHRGERRRAMEVLGVAHERFQRLGATPWVEQVEREITASGLRPGRRTVPAGAELTPQEQAVARLVARGLTNREAGAELVVSAKTVEHHLSRIYSKLGLRSRTELARSFPPEP